MASTAKERAEVPVFAKGCGISDFSGWAGVLHASKGGMHNENKL